MQAAAAPSTRAEPAPTAALAALAALAESAGLNASAPPEQRWLDGWLLRLSPGKAKRARCINALGEGALALDDRLARARSAYAEAGLPMLLRVTPFTRPQGLADELRARGWRRFDDTRVMLAPSLEAAMPGQDGTLPTTAAVRRLAPDAYAELVGAWRGSPPAQRLAHAARLQASPTRYQGFVVEHDGVPVGCGQFAREGDTVGLYDVFTDPARRGQGWGSGLCRWLLATAAREGARHAYLQVESDNHAARAIYHRLGFADAYAYHYLTDDPDAV